MYYNLIGKNYFATLYRVVCVLLCLAFINACAYRDEGEIDYRKTSFFDVNQDENNQVEPVRWAKLEHKNRSLGRDANISQNDYVTIRLMTAFIKNYTEGPWSMLNDALFEGQLRSRGEIAVLAKVSPLEEHEANYREDAHGEAHVVFYSNDVVAGQFLNFNNMPVYGPTKKGARHGLALELWIMELDTSTPIVGALLGKMATSFNPTGGVGNQVLGGLGESLLNASGANDVNFLYRVLFEPREIDDREPPQAFLEEGHHVFIRTEKRVRVQRVEWSKLRLNVNTGRLYKCLDDNQNTQETNECKNGKEEYKDNNYLVLRINKSDHQEGDFTKEIYGQIFTEFDSITSESKGYGTLISHLTKFSIQPVLDAIYAFKKKKDSIAMCEVDSGNCPKGCSDGDTGCINKCNANKIQCKKNGRKSCEKVLKDIINEFEIYWQDHSGTLKENYQAREEASKRLRNVIHKAGELEEVMIPYFDWADEAKLDDQKKLVKTKILENLKCQEIHDEEESSEEEISEEEAGEAG